LPQRVAITGIGVVTSIGTGREPFWNNLLEGRSGTGPVESFDTSSYRVHNGGEVKQFCARDYVHKLNPDHLGRASQFAIAAARLALQDAGVDPQAVEPQRAAVSMGTTSGEPRQIERFDDYYVEKKLDQVGAEVLALYPCHVIAGHLSSELGFSGGSMMIPAACAAGNYAIAHAMDELQLERADLVLAGGADAFSRITFSGFARLMAIAPEVCQPFARNRKGMIPGEGAGVLVLETVERALQRGARIYAEIAGYGLSCDAYHMTGGHPEGDGAARAIEKALGESGIEPHQVSYISAHGTGTLTNDLLETQVVKRVFGKAAYRIPISSVKSMLGHTMGAASAIEAVVCALAIDADHIPPTAHLDEADPQCDLDYVPHQARQHRVDVAMNNAYAFGGTNASLIMKKFAG
jgi:3-oxoacyl-[acyl-carrier-protein] synthase II